MQVRPQIRVKDKTIGRKEVYRLDQEKIEIGREPSNYITLTNKAVSRRHAEITQEGEQFFLRDLGSTHGTFLNKNKVTPHEKILLRSTDNIFIGDFELSFVIPEKDAVQKIHETTDTDVLEVKMVKKLLKAMDRQSAPSLEIVDGPLAGKRFALEGKTQDILIGRDMACEFVIDSDVISRKHARVEKRYETVILHDLGSKNGVYVNRERIKEKILKDGDTLHFGTLTLVFHNPLELSFELAPPAIKKRVEPPPSPPPAPEPSLSVEEPQKEEPVDVPEEPAPPPPISIARRFSKGELVALAIGLLVLLGSLWGILKLLK